MRRLLLVLTMILVLLACQQRSDERSIDGYIEGDYRLISAPQSGWLTQMTVREGDVLALGALVARLDESNQQLALTAAQAQYARLKALWENMRSGARKSSRCSLLLW